MKNALLLATLLTSTLVIGGTSAAQDAKRDAAAKPKPKPLQAVIVPTGVHDPREVAECIARVFNKEVFATPLMRQSAVILRIPEGRRDEVMSVVKEVTPATPTIRARLVLLAAETPLTHEEIETLSGPSESVKKVIEGLVRNNRITISNDAELTLIQNTEATLQTGERIANNVGTVQTGPGRSSPRFEWVDVGTIISLRAKVDEDQVTTDLNFEKTFKRPEAMGEGQETTRHGVSTLQHQSTVRIRSGHAQTVARMVETSSDDSSVVHILIFAVEVI